MTQRRVGLWLIGALGGVGSTVALGLAAIARGLHPPIGMVTGLSGFEAIDLDGLSSFVVGGHDIRRSSFLESVRSLHERSNIFSEADLQVCSADLLAWSENIRPGTVIETGATIQSMVAWPEVQRVRSPKEAIERIQADLRSFQERHQLAQVVVVNVASTEPAFPNDVDQLSLDELQRRLNRAEEATLPASSIYAYAAIDIGLPYINFTPSLGTSLPALQELATIRRVPIAGKDGKTGETLLKAVLAPMFAARNLRVLSWVGHNILGGGDGRVLSDPVNKASKVRTKDATLAEILGYKPQTHVSIEYIESLDDWKTAWDHIHFEGFLGVKMTMQFTWQGCDSILAAPLIIDLARLTLLAQRRGESGILTHLASFFKSPQGVNEHQFSRQHDLLVAYLRTLLPQT